MLNNLRTLTSRGIPSAKAFSKAIVEAEEGTCTENEPVKKSWFATASEILKPHIIARNEANEKLKEDPTPTTKEIFRTSRLRLFNKEVVRAKNRSEFDKATKIMETMRTRPRKAWKKMRSLQAGHNLPHQTIQAVNFSENGVKATNNKESLQIACNHFEKVYNRESFFDPTVIDDVSQCPENPNFDQLPSLEELNKAIAEMALLAAPGESGLSPIAMKKLPMEARETLLSIVHRFWNGLDENPEWNQALLYYIQEKRQTGRPQQLQRCMPTRPDCEVCILDCQLLPPRYVKGTRD